MLEWQMWSILFWEENVYGVDDDDDNNDDGDTRMSCLDDDGLML